LAATREARARAKIKLVAIIRKAAKTNPHHAEWLLERSWASEYSRVTVERFEEEKDASKSGLTILYQTPKGGLAELLDFPNLETDSPELGREKQARLLGQTMEAPERISDAPPPKVVPKALTGRIRPEWKGNGK
jgi:hypothetical protein